MRKTVATSYPTEALRPPGEKPHVRGGQLMLPLGPGHLFDRHAAAGTVDAPHHVQEEHAQPPQRDELEAASGQPIVGLPALPASGTRGPIARVRHNVDRQCQSVDLLLLNYQSLGRGFFWPLFSGTLGTAAVAVRIKRLLRRICGSLAQQAERCGCLSFV